MGNRTQKSSVPEYYSYNEVKSLINELNNLFQNNYKSIKINLFLVPSRLTYVHQNWKKSMIPGQVSVWPKHQQQPDDNIILTIQDVYSMYDTLQHFKRTKATTPLDHPKRDSMTPQNIPSSQQKECCLCWQRFSSCALPCSHTFCEKCTNKFIIEAQEKKCPQCRAVFEGSTESVAKKVYTIIQQEDEVFEQVREIIMSIIGVNNENIMNKMNKQLSLRK